MVRAWEWRIPTVTPLSSAPLPAPDAAGAPCLPSASAGRPRALDLYCGGGGATRGLQLAGFHVTGVDIRPQPRYVGDLFVQADALAPPFDLSQFDFIWASPPCQSYSWASGRHRASGAVYPDLVGATRDLLMMSGRPFVIENVVGAPIRHDLVLTGMMFGLEVIRRRNFEFSFFVLGPPHGPKRGSVRDGAFVTVAGHGGDNIKGRGSRAAKQSAMGIDWMDDHELNQSIPPAYAHFIGRAALAHIRAEAA